jgi:hypothetical protein
MKRAALTLAMMVFAAPAEAKTATRVAALGQTVRLGPIAVKPIRVVEDSRCPRLVTCVWRGRVRLTIIAGGERLTIDDGVPVNVAKGRLTLVDAVPLSQRGEVPSPGAYRFKFRFER